MIDGDVPRKTFTVAEADEIRDLLDELPRARRAAPCDGLRASRPLAQSRRGSSSHAERISGSRYAWRSERRMVAHGSAAAD
jgi:hypothetical protein